MGGTAIPPALLSGTDIAAGRALTPSFVNSFRISAVADRLAMHIRGSAKNDPVEFFNLCLSLARGIDYAIANSEVPSKAHDLPSVLKQIHHHKNDPSLQAAVMVLMISVKNACKMRWFPDKDSEELLSFANEIGSSFCSVRDPNTEVSGSLPIISKIMLRYYPRMKMGQILVFLEAKPGYGAFVNDFHISKNAKSNPEDKIRLFVAQTDNIEISSCIISPPQVNFLLNGKGVERRTNILMDSGPQLPTVVTQMLKYGTNLLQAVGQFNGNYIIVIAFMSAISNLDCPVLEDYVQPAIAALDTDSEIIEGPSRISLNCPISFKRIATPVKGHSCKHIQCFDFDNYVNINSRRPSWRCPHCNQYVCYTDIRIDQNMVKVLKEVGKNVADVIISADGSWKSVSESNDHNDQSHDKPSNCLPDCPPQEPNRLSDAIPEVFYLSEGDDEMDVIRTCETEDRKPFLACTQSQSNGKDLTIHADNNNTNEINQNTSPIEDDFWSGIFLSTCGSGTSSTISVAQVIGGVSESVPNNQMLSPVLTDAVSPALNREPETYSGSPLITTSTPQSQVSASNNLQLQQSMLGNSTAVNEYGRFPSIPRHVNRTPIAVQALPAPNLTSASQQRSRNSLNPLVPNVASLPSKTSALPSVTDFFSTVPNDVERQQQLSRLHLNPPQVSNMTSSSLHQQSSKQDHLFTSSQSAQLVAGPQASSQLLGGYRVPSAVPTPQQNSQQQLSLNPRVSLSTNQIPPPSAHFPQSQVHQGSSRSGVGNPSGTGSGSQQARQLMAAQQAAQRALMTHLAGQSPSMSVPIQTPRASSFQTNIDGFRASLGEQRANIGATVQPVARADGSVDLPAEQNWRPTGRMRGSLSGRAYSAALSQYIIQPTQPVQTPRPPPPMTSPQPGIPPQLHVLMANSRSAHAPQPENMPLPDPPSQPAAMPERSLGMQ